MTPRGAVSAAGDPIPPELVSRFKAALDRLNPGGENIGLAVSGGPDSMAMLLLTHAAISGRFAVATVDHGLRPESADECTLVAQVCAARGIPCEILRVDVGAGNVQAEARQARYAALEDWAVRNGLAAIATAHHADDQAETLLMRLNRGSGLAGLAGVRRASPAATGRLTVVRPLLDFRREELAEIVENAGVPFASDPSNSDPRYDRVRIRRALADADWLDVEAVGKAALNLAEANEALEYEVARFWDEHARTEGSAIRLRLHPMRAMRLRLIARALAELGGGARGGEIAALDDLLAKARRANLGGVLVELKLEADGPFLHFSPEPPRRRG